ncbi:MAG: NfeD family protein, partial [Treponema sp.]|nr:NfeD family protein [Treponema sp.]
IFVIIALLLLIFTRPIFIQKLNINKVATNIEALTGKKVTIIDSIPENGKGTIKLNGIIWNAQAETKTAISSGTLCIVKTFEGNTAIVSALS